jgi:hypothetical protein
MLFFQSYRVALTCTIGDSNRCIQELPLLFNSLCSHTKVQQNKLGDPLYCMIHKGISVHSSCNIQQIYNNNKLLVPTYDLRNLHMPLSFRFQSLKPNETVLQIPINKHFIRILFHLVLIVHPAAILVGLLT